MSVPKYNEFMPSIIKCMSDGKLYTLKELVMFCAKEFKLTEADMSETLASGQTRLMNRVGWAKTYLTKAGLIYSPKRAYSCLTEEGVKAFNNGPEKVTLEYLEKFDSFQQFNKQCKHKSNGNISSDNADLTEQNPTEQIETAINELHLALADELMSEIMKISPYEFERLVVNLLIKMGYGSVEENKNAVTAKSGDEGIDGIVSADKFGFDAVYIQAKQWDVKSVVGRPEIQKFLGALVGKGATKGIFITTAQFSNEAVKFAANSTQNKIVLVNGAQLTKLMIEYDLGVSTAAVYKLKRIDSDFFNDGI